MTPQLTIGHYRVQSKVGEGGMGTVYKAFDTRLERFVALKTVSTAKPLSHDRRLRILREAKAASMLNHPNIVIIYDILDHEDQLYIAMELVEGATLAELIHTRGVSIDDSLRYAAQLAHALVKTHAAGMVHRDLKPSNIMITRDGQVKILDFGLAKWTEPEPGSSVETATLALTQEGVIVGSTGYMSPEQAEGLRVDARSDIFSFGLVLYEMATGQRAFQKSTRLATLASVLHDQPTPMHELLPQCPRELEALVDRCLAKRREDRYQSMAEVARALEAVSPQPGGWQAAPPQRVVQGSAIAVLPFTNLSADPDADYFGDGLAEEIITALSKVRSLRITARTSAFRFRSKGLDLREVGDKLNVSYILLGSVRRAGARVRVTVELVSPHDECQLWSERYDRNMDDIFSIQDEIATAVVEALKDHIPEISDTLRHIIEQRQKEIPIRNVGAHEDFLRGRHCLARRSWDSLRRAIGYFEAALRQDPTAALAKVGIADCYNLLGYYNERRPHEAFPKAKAAASEAIQIDSRLGEAHATLGYSLLCYDWNWAGAERAFQQSERFSPGYTSSRHWKTWLHFARGEFPVALNCIREAQQADPLAPILNSHVGLALAYNNRTAEAIQQLLAAIDLDPNFFLAHYHLGTVYCLDGQSGKAIAALENADRLSNATLGAGLLACAYGIAGRTEDACRILHRMETAIDYVSPLELAYAHAGLGQTEEAFRLIESACDHRSSDLIRLRLQPWPAAMRQDARFEAIAERIGLPAA